MHITKLYIKNFKCFEGDFVLSLNKDINIIVGNNEAGKSTILEAIQLVLTGLYQGKSIKSDLSQYLFNYNIVKQYIASLATDKKQSPPSIIIEVYFEEESYPKYEGDYNFLENKACGVKLDISFNEKYSQEYLQLVNNGIQTLPLEFYDISWSGFSRELIIPRLIPLKCAFIDSSNIKTKSNNDLLLYRIINDNLEDNDEVGLIQSFRQLQESFKESGAIQQLNDKINKNCDLSSKQIRLGVNFSSRSAWVDYLTPYIDEIPFTYIGKGEQAVIKTQLSLINKRADDANVILIEEPENHLSHTKLNSLLASIKNRCGGKQVIISTHSSFVANKLGLRSLIFINDHKDFRLNELDTETTEYFEKLPGYDTLRLLLCKSAILVEGASDELIVQKAYFTKYNKLPIEDEIDVISINNLSFMRFLKISKLLNLKVSVITDNDGNIAALDKKYEEFKSSQNIHIFYDTYIDNRDNINGNKFNFNTLEPVILRCNSKELLNRIFHKNYCTDEELLKYMKTNKVDCALLIFKSDDSGFVFPEYIIEAIDFAKNE